MEEVILSQEGEFKEAFLYEVKALRKVAEAQEQHLTAVQMQLNLMQKLVQEHDRILVRGNGHPSLQETVRTLAASMDRFITQHNCGEEEAKNERKKWKWLLIGTVVPILFTLIGYLFILVVKILPLIE